MTTKEITGKIVNETFFGLACVACGLSGLLILPEGSFLRACCICLTLIFGLFFYVGTIFRVKGNHYLRPAWKTFWMAVVVVLPVVGGLMYYYLRLLLGYLPIHTRLRFRRSAVMHVAVVETTVDSSDETDLAAVLVVGEPETSFSDSYKSTNFRAAEGITPF
jgi:hypothetical protein